MRTSKFNKTELYALLKVSSMYSLSLYEKVILNSLEDIANEEYIRCLYDCRRKGYIKDNRIRLRDGVEIINSLPNSEILLTEKGLKKLSDLKKSYLSKCWINFLIYCLKKTAYLWFAALITVLVDRCLS